MELAKRYQKYYSIILPSSDICLDPLLAAETIVPLSKEKIAPDFFSMSEKQRASTEKPILSTFMKKKFSQDSKSTPMSPLNLSHESGSHKSENKLVASTSNIHKKACSTNITALPTDDCQVINLSDSDSNLDDDIPQLNPFFNDFQDTEDFISYVSHFDGGGSPK